MQLFDTLRGQIAPLEIPSDRPLTLYVCGVTPYDTTHIGHAHTFLIFDVLIRYLRHLGAEVRYCQNVTDVDTPLFERASRDSVAWDELARHETEQFVRDCRALNLIPPTFFPKASDEIPYMIPIVERLISLGHAYERGGSVYFSVKTDPEYGAMTRLGYADMLKVANERGNIPDDPNKNDPLDFVLWQAAAPGEPTWQSPWGPGRPGWHIECTSMSTRYLGEQIDIHGGGRDLIFPHHPSEIAQTEAYSGKRPFVRFWMHGGMAFLGGEKMSKSLGNMVFIRDALNQHSADALRWYLLSFPYRDDFHYQRDGVVAAEAQLARLRDALAASGGSGPALDAAGARDAYFAALDNDLQLPAALAQLDQLSGAILAAAAEGHAVADAQAALRTMAGVFGFWAAE
ncbi:MAG TPA: cysteine--tRNA ligase [Kouleothrix sp.]|uniref:cysteine--tRNA ligase n=1 Tax=Kouleothrix sp. TaxID=2779161 RepID=UPI002BF1DF4F|nr:cysteine--tRNA ligase [Kouleothrix sp.]